MGQACSSSSAAAGLAPRDTTREVAASGVAPKPGVLSAGQPGQLTSHPDKRRSTGDKHVSIVPTVTAVSSDRKSTTEAIKSGQGSSVGHLPTPAASITAPLNQRPYADEESLLVPVPEESLGAVAAASPVDPAGHHEQDEAAAETGDILAGQLATGMSQDEKIPMSEEIIHQHDDELAKCSSGSLIPSSQAARTDMSCMSTVSEHSYMTAVTAADGINDEASQSVLAVLPSAAMSRGPTDSFKSRSICGEEDTTTELKATEHTQDVGHKTQPSDEQPELEPVVGSKGQHEVEAVKKAEQDSHKTFTDSEHVVEQPVEAETNVEDNSLNGQHQDAAAPGTAQHDTAVPEDVSEAEKPVKECSEAGALDEAEHMNEQPKEVHTILPHEVENATKDSSTTVDCVHEVAADPEQPAEQDGDGNVTEQHAADQVLDEGAAAASGEQQAEEHASEAADEAEQVESHAGQEQQE